MADDEQRNDSGSRDRATVALVDAKVDGLKDLIRAEFATVKEDVKALAAIVADVIKQGVLIQDLERRLTKVENESTTEADVRRVNRAQIIAAIAVIVAIAAVVVPLIAGAYHYG